MPTLKYIIFHDKTMGLIASDHVEDDLTIHFLFILTKTKETERKKGRKEGRERGTQGGKEGGKKKNCLT